MILRNRNFKLSEGTIPLEWKIWRSIIPARGEEYIRGIETFSLAACPRVIYRRYVLLRFDRGEPARVASFSPELFPPNAAEFFLARLRDRITRGERVGEIGESNECIMRGWAKDCVERIEIRNGQALSPRVKRRSGPSNGEKLLFTIEENCPKKEVGSSGRKHVPSRR